MTTLVSGAPLQPVSISTAEPQGNVAIPIYGYDTAPSNLPVLGGPAIPVKILSASDLIQNGGKYALAAMPAAMGVVTAIIGTPTLGQLPIAVYPLNTYPTPPWYRAGGAPMPLVAYQPKGAADLAASYVNLANPGTHDCAVGVAPTLGANGWTFNGTTQYLSTITPANGNYTYMVQFGELTNTGQLIGEGGTGAGNCTVRMTPNLSGFIFIRNTGTATAAGQGMTSGNLCIAGRKAYKNGVDLNINSTDWTAFTPFPLFIGAQNNAGSPSDFCANTTRGLVIWDSVLTPTQIAAVAAAMASF